jgi:signal peptidase I
MAASWQRTLVSLTERVLTRRKRRRIRKRERQKNKNQILDWIEAFIWAAFVVLLINQYLLQAYQIPSGSMIPTLRLQDRIFVNKIVSGPELLPGVGKLSGFAEPERAEVVIFENPSYISRGPAFDIVQRVLYMITLSLVDIDRDEYGRPRAHFLIKRAAGVEGDRFRLEQGFMEIKPEGESSWMSEESFQELAGVSYPVRRMVEAERYELFKKAARAVAYQDLDVLVPRENARALDELRASELVDGYYLDEMRSYALYTADPSDARYRRRSEMHRLGWYVPEDRIFPLGDNRDNSRDARSFGAVHTRNVLGRAMFRYWPLGRIGAID